MPESSNTTATYSTATQIAAKLIRRESITPEDGGCQNYIESLLAPLGFVRTGVDAGGIINSIYTRTGELKGRLAFAGHTDVVPTGPLEDWPHPPFDAVIEDGPDGKLLHGRGAQDMKGGVAMMLAAFLRAKAEGLELPGDVVLAIVSDEEAAGDFGARFLVEKHPDLFDDIRYAIGEFGGFTLYVGNRRFYPIQVAEKHLCWLKATVRGSGGHGSIPVRGGAMARLSELLRKIDQHRLPVHVTPVARLMFKTMASSLAGLNGLILRQLLNPLLTNRVLNLLGDRGRLFDPLLHNTVSATILHGSEKINVIPSEISVELDGRLLPGYQPDDLIGELRQIIGNHVELELLRHDSGPTEPDMGLFDTLAGILREADPNGIPVPLLLTGATDARFFSQLGIQTYGFLPMPLPEDFNFIQTAHAADERIPIDAVEFGANAIYKVLERF